ncbi:MAG: hypothetical protein Q9220_006857 [cf. Caloplaca sp. 1 TL-2023]
MATSSRSTSPPPTNLIPQKVPSADMHETRLLHFFSRPSSDYWQLNAPASQGIPLSLGTAIPTSDLKNLTRGAWGNWLSEYGLFEAITRVMADGGVMSGWKLHSAGDVYCTFATATNSKPGVSMTKEADRNVVVVVIKDLDKSTGPKNEDGLGGAEISDSKEEVQGLEKGSGQCSKATLTCPFGSPASIDSRDNKFNNGPPSRTWSDLAAAPKKPGWNSGWNTGTDGNEACSCSECYHPMHGRQVEPKENKKADIDKPADKAGYQKWWSERPCDCPHRDHQVNRAHRNKESQMEGTDGKYVERASGFGWHRTNRPDYTPESSAGQGRQQANHGRSSPLGW